MYARRTESLDASEIEKLVNISSKSTFGNPNLINLVEKSLLSITLTSENGEIVGYASFFDYPRIPDIDCCDEWNQISLIQTFSLANSLNSLFMHYFLSKPEIESSVLNEIINTVFNTASNIHYIFLNTEKPKLSDNLSEHFSLIRLSGNSLHWFGLKRESYMPTLFVRVAKPEDMDDLAPIFNEQTSVLKEVYGEFYLAEMIAAQNDTTKCLVAEVGRLAVGFMSVTTEANLNLLNWGYLIEPFNGFKKPCQSYKEESEKIQQDDIRSSSAEHSVPVVISDQNADYTTSETLSGTITSQYRFPSSFSKKSTQNFDMVPQFDGKPNAIVIQLFAINEIYEMRSLDFLLHVFELFPGRDYLLITVPFLVPEFSLLEHFVRVTPRPGIILPHELYIFNKGSLLSNFNVRQACMSDDKGVQNLIKTLDLNNRILCDLEDYHLARRTEGGVNLFCFVAECADQIVGIAILHQEEDIEYIRSHYNIEDFIYFTHHKREEHGHLKHFAINPIFKRLSKAFLKEVMRKCHKTSLYFPVYKPWASKSVVDEHSLVTNIPDLVPVRPRRQIVYDLKRLQDNSPTDRVLKNQEGYCLLHFNRKLVMEPKVTINARIVVIGASTTGLSFLDSLVFCPHLKFNNLYLVSPNGLPDNYEEEELVEQLMGKNFYFSKKKLELSALRIQVHVVKGYMTAIDRKKKLIKVDNKNFLPYDHMVIATGLQYTTPCPTEAKIQDLPITSELRNLPSRRYSEMVFKKHMEKVVPQNLFSVNDPFDAVKLIQFIKTHMINNYCKVIIYGHSFESYCCLHTLMAMGIHGNRIHFVKPPSDEEHYPLNNPIVEEAVYETLKQAGVHVHDGYCIAQFDDSNNVPLWIHSASFTTHGPPLRLECNLFISYYKKVVNYLAFRAMNDACLVFDSRLVIDTLFHTNDVSIRAAGPVIKFKRRYYNEQWDHSRFNSKTVGEELSKVFLQLFDPTLAQIDTTQSEVPLIPVYNDAIVKSCILPGGFLYLNVSKPSLDIPLDILTAQSNYGKILTTGSPQNEGYFRLHLNQYKKVETITCLRKTTYPVDNYIHLYGVHERALNNLESRFEDGLINNLFDFFDDNWALAFYHDRFTDLKDEIKELLMTRSSPCKLSFEETVRNMMSDGIGLTMEQKKELMDEFKNSNAKATVDMRLISFITYNYYHLPMYTKPDLI